MKNLLLTGSLLLSCVVFSQVQFGEVNTSQLEPSAIVEVKAANKGFLPPRIADPATAIANPAKGLVVFNTSANCLAVNVGTSTAGNFQCVGAQVNRNRAGRNENTSNTFNLNERG